MTRSLLPVLVLISCMRSAIGADPSPITLDSIVKALQAREKALTSFEIHGREYIADDNGNRIEPSVLFKFTYACASGGRVELRNVVYNPGSDVPFLDWYRDDGQKLYKMRSFDGAGEVVGSVRIRPTPNSSSENRVGKNILIHALSPLGTKLSDLVATAKKISVRDGENGDRIVSMSARKGEAAIDLVLSERHDFLPLSIDFGRSYTITVTGFQLIDGIQFPKAGFETMKQMNGEPMKLAFMVDSVSVNLPDVSDRFALPKLENGVLVVDETENSRYVIGTRKNDTKAAERVREAFEKKYSLIVSEVASKSSGPHDLSSKPAHGRIEKSASRDPETSSIPRWLFGVSFTSIMIAICVTYRMRS